MSAANPDLDPRFCVFRHVMRTSRSVAQRFDAALASTGLTAGQFNLMMTLYANGPLNVGEVARVVGMDPTSVPRAAKPLIERGLIQQVPGADRRERVLSLTNAGMHATMAATPEWARVQKSVVDTMGDAAWARAITMLKQITVAAQTGPAAQGTPSSN